MQIAKIVLYKDATRKRVLDFHLGQVNIIAGDSKTGKSALIDIVDYCLASDECHVASGVIRDNVFWFAIVVVFDRDYYFIARQNPDTKKVSSINEMYLARVQESVIPEFDDIFPNTNNNSVKEFLAAKIGLFENIQPVDDGGTREPLSVTFKHCRQFCFQPQSLIANKDFLFYHTANTFSWLALKDAIPFLWGAIDDNILIIENKIKVLKKELRKLYLKKREQEDIASEFSSLAKTLLEEAKSVSLINQSSYDSPDDILTILKDIVKWNPDDVIVDATNIYSQIQDLVSQRLEMIEKLGDIQERISLATRYVNNSILYQEELSIQHHRLRSIELIPKDGEFFCPICHHELSDNVPKVSDIYASFEKISAALANSKKQLERNQKYVANLLEEESELKCKISNIEESINALYRREDDAQRLKDLNLQRGKVIGRISLFLEKIQIEHQDNLDNEINTLEVEIESLKSRISKSTKDDLMTSKTAIIDSYMNKAWKRQLDLEDDEAIVSFDPKRLQLYIISRDERYVPLSQTGSGANWVGYHLLLHFALHKFYIKNNRPIPRFLFIDQPSQVYFPTDATDISAIPNKDLDAVKRMFSFMINRTNEADGRFQVILTEHAIINDDFFKSHIIETWLDGKKLIPEEWYHSN